MTITHQTISRSVIAVPPLARNDDYSINVDANRQIIEYIKAGGVSNFLYGGNANFYHIRLSEYRELLSMLSEFMSDDTWIIPSVGPAYGTLMDQAEIVKDFDFPTVMVLPHRELATSEGIATAIEQFVNIAGIPIVLYIKHDGWLDVATVKRLVDGGMVSMIKYAIVREDPADDAYLNELADHVDKRLIVSGIGEQPAIVHMRDFGLAGFTSGCVCVAPSKSTKMLAAIKNQEFDEAEALRSEFRALEDLRNTINPIRVLHDAVRLVEIADTGPVLPLLSNTTAQQQSEIQAAAVELRQLDQSSKV